MLTDTTTTASTIICTVLAGPAGIDMGSFSGASEAEILDAYARTTGYADFAALADTLGQTVEQARADLQLVEEIAEHASATETR